MAELGLRGGRVLEYVVGGPVDGFPLVVHHGTPSGAVLYPRLVEAAAEHGLRTILPGRPGYGGSSAALATGIAGWRDDDLAFLTGWGFGLDAFDVPVALWQGDQDRMVPVDHGRWLAAHVSGAAVHLLPGEGHLSLLTRLLGEILADLARAAA